MIDPQQGIVYQTGDVAGANARAYFDVSFGLAAQWKGLYLGGSVHHVNTPNISLIAGERILPVRYSVHGGYNFNFKLGSSEKPRMLTLSPSVFYQQQQGFDMLTLGAYIDFVGATLGIFSRSNDALMIILGYDFNVIRLAYSYDFTRSLLTHQTGGSHEISLSYRISAKWRSERIDNFQFPKF